MKNALGENKKIDQEIVKFVEGKQHHRNIIDWLVFTAV